jgi:methylglutaconyl-CoA hydratase
MNKVDLKTDDRGVARINLNNPEKHNAFDDAIILQLDAAFKAVSANPDVKAVVLGSNGKHFSAGADLEWMKRMADYSYEDNLADARALANMLSSLKQIPQPTIARVQGAAYGGAVGLVSCCDIAVASTHASFALSEVKLGLVPATISPYVIDAIGARQAQRYFVTAERFKAQRGFDIGLVHEVVENQDLDEVIDQLLEHILANGPSAVQIAKELINTVSDQPLDQPLIDHTCEVIANIRISPEGQEGLNAFLNKRNPQWQRD